MDKQILLNKNRGKRSVNVENGLLLPISTEERLLPFDDISDVVNLQDVYNKERDDSDLYRIILNINPVCTNVLFNMYTEIVYKEGDDDCTIIKNSGNTKIKYKNRPCNPSDLNHVQAIRDTEYNHPEICEDLVYHCGTDIFNNHILRNNGFVVVAKILNGDKRFFNTIKDYQRDKDGKNATLNLSRSTIPLHLYNAENLLTFKEAFRSRLIEDEGWFGFTNTSLLDIPNVEINDGEDTITVNKVINSNKPCEFIDMFPDRSLFSFIPKINKYKNRIEPNWDYCLTYPYKNEYYNFQRVNSHFTNDKDFLEFQEKYPHFHGIKVLRIFEGTNESGINSLFFETMLNHNLSSGDYVRLYYIVDKELRKSALKIKVSNIGDHTNSDRPHIFSISKNGIDNELFDELVKSKVDGEYALKMYVKKESEQGECDYYFRVFRKIPNFATSTLNIHDMNNDIEDVIKSCKKDYFKSENNRLSFAQNIYGDKMSQILFTDTIDLTRLVDNNGRKLTEIYFTVIKRNQGHKSWYQKENEAIYHDNDIENVEFSRAFGKVTSGLLMGKNDHCFNYNIRRMHNVPDDIINDNSILRIPPRPYVIENDLTIKGKSDTKVSGLFYGDIVERNPETCNETILEKVYHRFNTAQRETGVSTYGNLIYDVMLQDDNIDEFEYMSTNETGFKITEKRYGYDEGVKNANIAPEGYFYQPHFRIKINDTKDDITEKDTTFINFDKNKAYFSNGKNGTAMIVSSPKDYDFRKFDVFLLYEKDNFITNHHWGFLENIKNKTEITIKFETILKTMMDDISNGVKNGKYVLVKTNTNIPDYAIPSQIFPYKFRWKEPIEPSEVSSDSEIFKRPFTNGTHYINTNINFYLRRQDPFGEFYLQYGVREDDDSSVKYNPLIDLTPYGNYKDNTTYEYYSTESYNPCII